MTFDETFTFHAVQQLPDKTLKVKVLDRDKLCDDLMGECDIHLDLKNLPGDAGKVTRKMFTAIKAALQ